MNAHASPEFGPKTKTAIEELQSAFGYDTDGIVGKGTHGLIDAQTGHGWRIDEPSGVKRALEAQGKQTEKGSLAGAELKRTLKKGVEGGDVAYLQRRLNSLGYALEASGTFDDATENLVKKLQEAFGYTIDGVVGQGTNKLINAQIGHGWSAGAKTDAKAAVAKDAAAKGAPAKG